MNDFSGKGEGGKIRRGRPPKKDIQVMKNEGV